MATVTLTEDAAEQFDDLPRLIQRRVLGVLDRLADWPEVSGAKPLRGDLQGSFRIRTGDYRVIFDISIDGEQVRVWKIGYRGDIYD